MEKLNKKVKHDHKFTNILKATIFAIVMLAPFLSVLSRCLYTLNPNAKDSYSNEMLEKYTKVNSNSMLVEYNTYQLIYSTNTGNNASFDIYDTNLNEYIDTNNRTISGFALINEAYARMNVYYTNGDTQRIDNWNTYTTSFTFILKETNYQSTNNLPKANLYLLTYTKQPLDNAFEYSINQLKENDIYNWAENTGIYTTIQDFTSRMGANDVIALLLAYWSILTAIYIVFDIIIAIFVKITHMIGTE